MRLQLTSEASLDLQLISNYTFENWGETQENLYLQGLWSRLEEIARSPEKFKSRPDLGKGCHSTRYQKHMIFFFVGCDSVTAVRILHASMDFRSHLPDGSFE